MGDERAASDKERQRRAAMKRAYRDAASPPDPASVKTFALEVDGERFTVRVATNPTTPYTDTSYTWLSGPNKGYGFGGGGPPNPSLQDHRQRIREFLAMVDPTTGYIEDD